jgi:ribosomal protein L40E
MNNRLSQLTCPACGAPVQTQMRAGQQFSCAACGSALVLSDWTPDGSIVCGECGVENDSQGKFCRSCHAVLQAGCPYCYTLNPLSAERCRKCGVDLSRSWSRQRSWLEDKRQHDRNRQEALRQAQIEGRKAELERLFVQLDDPANHPMAVFCLQQIGTEAVEGLLGLLKDDDPDARYGAAHTLGLIGDKRAIPGLTGALQDPDPAVRFWSAAALGRLRAETAIPALARLLGDKSKEVRTAAGEALEHIGTPEATEALQKGSRGWRLFG